MIAAAFADGNAANWRLLRDHGQNEPEPAKPGQKSAGKQVEPRAPRSIRFSDSEWAGIEREAKSRGMNTAELVRHAAVGFATGELSSGSGAIPLDIAAQLERIYRGVYLLSTLKRDELILEGRQEELERIGKGNSQPRARVRKPSATIPPGMPTRRRRRPPPLPATTRTTRTTRRRPATPRRMPSPRRTRRPP